MPTPPLGVGLVGAGRIGTSHARMVAERVPDARLVAVADPRASVAQSLADAYDAHAYTDPAELLADPAVGAVVIAASTEAHADLVVAAAAAGKHVFCEKPMALTLADLDRAAGAASDAGVVLQVGFNRRFDPGFRAAHDAVTAGAVGTVQLMRSLTRDPAGDGEPSAVPPWVIFMLTLIHDFDTLLWLNPGAEPVEVFTSADALVAPQHKGSGHLDTAVVVITFDNGARAVAEASFAASYGYDVRCEVFGSEGMVTAGEGARSTMRLSTASGRSYDTARSDVELLGSSYVAELTEFVAAVREGRQPAVSAGDARRALSVALAAWESHRTHSPVPLRTSDAGTSGLAAAGAGTMGAVR